MTDPQKKKPQGTKAAAAKPKALKPVKLKAQDIETEQRDEGPRGWFLPVVESAYTRLAAGNAAPRSVPSGRTPQEAFASTLQPGQGETVLAEIPATFWVDLLKEYKK